MCELRGFINIFSRKVTGFHRRAKLNLFKENFCLDGQTRQAKLSSQPVNLPSAWLLINCWHLNVVFVAVIVVFISYGISNINCYAMDFQSSNWLLGLCEGQLFLQAKASCALLSSGTHSIERKPF